MDPAKEVSVNEVSDSQDIPAQTDVGDDQSQAADVLQQSEAASGSGAQDAPSDKRQDFKPNLDDVPEIKTWHRVVGIIVCLFIGFCFIYVNGSTWLRIWGIL